MVTELVRELPAWHALGVLSAPETVVEMLGLGPLATLLADARVTEIMVNGPNSIHVEVDGRLVPSGVCFRDEAQLRSVVERLLAGTGRRLDECSPTVDAMLADGTRLNAVVPPVAAHGTLLTLRRPRRAALDLEALVRCGSVPPRLAVFLHAAVAGRCNLLVSGGTGAGKTTLLAALSGLVPHDQRIVAIEDVAELRIDHPNLARQQCRDIGAAGVARIDMRALLRNTLRMRPDRIVVGEVRGPEAADMVAAMNTGHPGSMSTVHANSATDALLRLESMLALAWPALSAPTLRGWIAAAIDVVVQCTRDAEGRRRVGEVVALDGEGVPVTVFEAGCKELCLQPVPERCLARMAEHGVHYAADGQRGRSVA
jgi:pilus assembly protein CpaF